SNSVMIPLPSQRSSARSLKSLLEFLTSFLLFTSFLRRQGSTKSAFRTRWNKTPASAGVTFKVTAVSVVDAIAPFSSFIVSKPFR
ncbi:hypothetical protein, partial [Vibrio alfacsensis]|uniref:hypothetical protein n=1 Tax=Vibrio alfacsensis TaxID=1074311 RepID=UPI004068F9EB